MICENGVSFGDDAVDVDGRVHDPDRRGFVATHIRADARAIAGPQDMAPGTDRLRGFRRGLRSAGRPPDESLVAFGDFSGDSGEQAASRLLDARPDIDAIFAASDLMAIGAMQELRRRRLRVPEDVALVGFDDSLIAATTQPGLTSIHQPVGDLGRQMIVRLRELMDGSGPVAAATVLPTHLVVRQSS